MLSWMVTQWSFLETSTFPKLTGTHYLETLKRMLCFVRFFVNYLDQLVIEPIHCQGNTLDPILTNCLRIVHNINVTIHKKSCIPIDHFLISSSIQMPVLPASRPMSCFVDNFFKANFNQMTDYLLDCNF